MIIDTFKSSWPMIVIIAVTLICCRVAYLRHHHNVFSFHEEFWNLVKIMYIIILYMLVTNVDTKAISNVNLVPFSEITRYEFGSKYFMYYIVGNVLIFIPFGFMIASYIKPKKCWTNIIVGLIVSLTIEFVQLQIGRTFDIDDIILNVLGCFIGYLLYIGFNAIRNHVTILKTDWFNNLICIIIIVCIGLYLLNFWGIDVGI